MLDKVADPLDHGALAEAVAGSAVRVVLDIEHSRQRDAIGRPAAAVGQEEVGLGSAARDVGAGKVVATADEAGVGRVDVVLGEGAVGEAGAFGGLQRGLC